MRKKLIMSCMAVAAFAAFVIAPVASASPALTETTTGGPLIAVGSSIKATNTGVTKFTLERGGQSIECTHAEFRGTVTANSGTQIKVEIKKSAFGVNYTFSGTGTSGDCTSPLGSVKPTMTSALCLETVPGTDNVKYTGCGANITVTLDITGLPECNYAAASLTGTYLTNADATVNLTDPSTKEVGGSFLCPDEIFVDMDLDLTTTDGTTLFIS